MKEALDRASLPIGQYLTLGELCTCTQTYQQFSQNIDSIVSFKHFFISCLITNRASRLIRRMYSTLTLMVKRLDPDLDCDDLSVFEIGFET
jgi:hypothetical protein